MRKAVVFTFLLVGINFASQAGVIVGYDLIERDLFNLNLQTTYVATQTFGTPAVGGELTTWSFFPGNGTVLNELTPLLLEFSGGSDYILRAIGETFILGQTPGDGTNIAFNAQAGDATIINANYVFGWFDDLHTLNNSRSTIDYDNTGTFNMRALTGFSSQSFSGTDVGATFEFGESLGNRAYSFQAVVATVPEPSTYALIISGLLGMTFMHRKRRNQC